MSSRCERGCDRQRRRSVRRSKYGSAIRAEKLPKMSDPTMPPWAGLTIPEVPEIVLAMARPIGTDTSAVRTILEEELRRTGFLTVQISVAGLIDELFNKLQHEIREESASSRYERLMTFGDYLRFTRGEEAAADLVVRRIVDDRPAAQHRAREIDANGVAYVVRNLMHPAEVLQLRNIYKTRFFLLGVFGDERDRLEQLVRELSEGGDSEAKAVANAERLTDVDAGKRPSSVHLSRGSLSVDRTFHMADVFVSLSSSGGTQRAEETLHRFIDQLYANPFGTPEPTEIGMSHAYLAARNSGALARPVGAAIVDETGSLLSIGWNDPAAPGGGLYSESSDSEPDSSDPHRIDAIHYFVERLLSTETWTTQDTLEGLPFEEREWWLAFHRATEDLSPLTRAAVVSLVSLPEISATRIVNLIEFGRCVHAEMAAITDAARRGVAIQDATMYVTTFPCHECTRNVVAAGIAKVVFVEPYGKSLATKLYRRRSVDFHSGPPSRELATDRVHFLPYVGISPNRFDVLFSWVERKVGLKKLLDHPDQHAGAKVKWDRGAAGHLRDSVRGYQLDPEKGLKVDPLFEAAYALAEHGVVQRVIRSNEEALALRADAEDDNPKTEAS